MQVLVLAVQNAVDYKDLGVATSGATLFRSIGGSVGTAVLGSIFSNRLATELASTLPRSAGGIAGHRREPQHRRAAQAAGAHPPRLPRRPSPTRCRTVFIVAACVAAVAFLLSWALQQRPLRETVAASTGIGESFAAPKHTDSLAEASRALSVAHRPRGSPRAGGAAVPSAPASTSPPPRRG